MKIPLTFGQTKGRSSNLNAGECINMFPCFNGADSKDRLSLSGSYGLKRYLFLELGEVRGIHRVESALYAVCSNSVYSIISGVKTLLGTINTTTGPVWMEHNANDQLAICNGTSLWVVTMSAGTISQVSDVDFPGASSLTFQDQYGLVTEPETGRLWNSNLNDFTVWTGTDFVTAVAAPDNLLACKSEHQEVWAFGEDTIQVFDNTGDADAPFQPIVGYTQEIGIGAADSVAKKENVMFWLDSNLHVRMAQNYSPQIISSNAIHYQISNLSVTSDARGFAYTIAGHTFYVICFPTANKAYGFDLGESQRSGVMLWHELRSYEVDSDNRWRGNCVEEYGGTTYVGDFENGYIYTLDHETYTDNEEPLRREFTTQFVFEPTERKTIFHHELELEIEVGKSEITGQGSDPKIAMQYSDDTGKTWSNELWESLGEVGEYSQRVRWFALGESRNRLYRFILTDPVRCEIVSAFVRATAGVH